MGSDWVQPTVDRHNSFQKPEGVQCDCAKMYRFDIHPLRGCGSCNCLFPGLRPGLLTWKPYGLLEPNNCALIVLIANDIRLDLHDIGRKPTVNEAFAFCGQSFLSSFCKLFANEKALTALETVRA
jgi:hypothetical protein